MGIDIWGYRRIRKLEEEPGEGTPFFYAPFSAEARADHVAGLEFGVRYTYAEKHWFYGGKSEGFYEWLWEVLGVVAGEDAAWERWKAFHNNWRNLPTEEARRLWVETRDTLPFHEFRYFHHGSTTVLNAAVCRNLAADFAELEAKAMEMLGASSWFGRLYTDMRRAVEFAADDGALVLG